MEMLCDTTQTTTIQVNCARVLWIPTEDRRCLLLHSTSGVGDQCCPLGHRCCIKTVSTAPGARRIKDCNKAFRKQTATSSCAVQRLRVNYVLSTTPTELQFHERSESLKPVCVVTGL